jgi:hypothetical protein
MLRSARGAPPEGFLVKPSRGFVNYEIWIVLTIVAMAAA